MGAPKGRPRPAGSGRAKGQANRLTTDVKAAIVEALSTAHPEGAAGYLRKLALENSSAFATLIGKVIPLTVGFDQNKPLPVFVLKMGKENLNAKDQSDE